MNAIVASDTPSPPDGIVAGPALVAELNDVMDRMLALVESETGLVREGRLVEASELAQEKSDLARQYVAGASRLKSDPSIVAALGAQEREALRSRHDLFQALLQINLTVLATAHAVAEGMMRGVHDELARKAAPQTYGASGRTVAPPPSAAQPLTLSKVL